MFIKYNVIVAEIANKSMSRTRERNKYVLAFWTTLNLLVIQFLCLRLFFALFRWYF